jgi:molecular chaperone DnaK (HSP70)
VKKTSSGKSDETAFWKYFSEIESALSKKCGRKIFLSPLDWGLIESWQKRGVPLHIILKAIDSFDTAGNHKRKLNSLRIFRNKIESEFSFWLKRSVGKHDKNEPIVSKPLDANSLASEKQAHLQEKIDLLNSAITVNNEQIGKALSKTIAQLENLKQFNDFEALEVELEKLEKEINKALLTYADSETLEKLKREVEKQMSRYKFRTDEKTFKRNCELMLLKLLRKHYNIPHLGLFDV